jgi:hypothetical protein
MKAKQKKTFTARLVDTGEAIGSTTSTRDLTHAVGVWVDNKWAVLSWHASEAGAKATASASRWVEVYPIRTIAVACERIGMVSFSA